MQGTISQYSQEGKEKLIIRIPLTLTQFMIVVYMACWASTIYGWVTVDYIAFGIGSAFVIIISAVSIISSVTSDRFPKFRFRSGEEENN